jgi:hypothetical protein
LQDDDIMLANLKPSALNLYAPSGRPGGFLQLKPVPCTQQQQQQQQQGPQQMLSLAACNGAAAAGAAAAGSCAWYNPWEDDVMCVFEWDSSETPLALKHGRWAYHAVNLRRQLHIGLLMQRSTERQQGHWIGKCACCGAG